MNSLRAFTVGNPNVGKSSLINALAGSELHVGNWQGTTVEKLEVQFSLGETKFDLVDLPGAYSLAGASGEEAITRDELCSHPPDLIINVVDSGNLERNLALTLELCELGLPMVVVLNLWDEAQARGHHIDTAKLSQELGVPVVTSVARLGQGIEELKSALSQAAVPRQPVRYPQNVEDCIESLQGALGASRWLCLAYLCEDAQTFQVPARALDLRRHLEESQDPFLAISEARLVGVSHLVSECCEHCATTRSVTHTIDSFVLHRVLGLPIFLLGMLLLFRFTFLFSQPWVKCLQGIKDVLGGWCSQLPLPALLVAFLNHGVLDGLGTVAAFVPVLFLLYLFLGFLESSGFLARATFVFDRMMAMLGLPGRGLLPLLLGFGCNVAAVYATRTVDNRRDRMRIALATPFMACSARLTVFVLFGTVFFPKTGSTVVFGLYLLGLLVGLGTAALIGLFVPGVNHSAGIMELPPYRFPPASLVFRLAQRHVVRFLQGATLPILVTVMVVWVLMSIPQGDPSNSLYARGSKVIQRLLSPIGVQDWRLAGALVPGFIAKEVVIGTLGVSFLGAEPDTKIGFSDGLKQMGGALWTAVKETGSAIPQLVGAPSLMGETEASSELQKALAASMTPAGALAYLVFMLLYTPCVATLAALKQEVGTRWAAVSLGYSLVIAYFLAGVTYLWANH